MAVRTERAVERGSPPPAPPSARIGRWWPVLLLVAVALVLRLVNPGSVAWLQNMFVVFGSLMVEAVPFVALGAFVSATIEVFVPPSVFARIGRLPRAFQLPAAAMVGMAFPVCECGSVPVARRLARKGLTPAAAVTFMLAAPIVNPVVIASTYVAYRGRDIVGVMVFGRLALGFAIAIIVGWVVGRKRADDLLRARRAEVDHHDDERGRATRFFGHLTGDLVFMGRFLIVGAAAAAAIQTFVPQTFLDGLASMPVLSIVAMMVLAYVLSLCSESDAFVAASFVQFSAAAQLAFLVFGPMVDTKLSALYLGTFGRGFLRTVVIAVGSTTLVAALWVEVLLP
jgi:uncharacterized membrane protein YraQ (UPF0718 family)